MSCLTCLLRRSPLYFPDSSKNRVRKKEMLISAIDIQGLGFNHGGLSFPSDISNHAIPDLRLYHAAFYCLFRNIRGAFIPRVSWRWNERIDYLDSEGSFSDS